MTTGGGGGGETVKLDQQGLPAAATGWRASLPPLPAHPPIPVDSNALSAAVAEGMAHWPASHAAMCAQRDADADHLMAAVGGTVTNLTIGDQTVADQLNAVDE
jgi:hypothetical protein